MTSGGDVRVPLGGDADVMTGAAGVVPSGGAAPGTSGDPVAARVVVTGAGGFIGAHVVQALCQAGYRVRAVTRNVARPAEAGHPAGVLPRPAEATPGGTGTCVETVLHPGIEPDADWRPLLAGADAVVHLAGMAHLALDNRTMRRRLRRINVVSTQRLAQAAAASGISTFIFMSSIKAVSDHSDDAPLTETSPLRPEDCYGAAKLAGERRLSRIAHEFPAMRMLILRPPLVYGPGAGANFAAFSRAVGRGLPLPLAAVRNRRSLIYVGNLAGAVVRCLQRPDVPSGTFHLSDGAPVSTPALARAIAQAQGRQARLFALPAVWLASVAAILGRAAQMKRLTGSLEVSNRHFCRSFAWEPTFTLEQGLRATLRKKA